MSDKKTNGSIVLLVIMIFASIACLIKGVFSWIESQHYKYWFLFAILLFIGAFVVPIIMVFFDTKKELCTINKDNDSIELKEEPTKGGTQAIIEDAPIHVLSIEESKNRFADELNRIPFEKPDFSSDKINRRLVSDMPEINTTNIIKSTNIYKLFPLVVIDTETTGLRPKGNDIIEIAAIKFEYPFSPVSSFSMLLKPRGSISADASSVNGITNDMVKDCPPFTAIVPSLSRYIDGCNIVGHNLLFDLKFLFVCGLDLPTNVKYYDTLDLAKKTLVKYGSKKYNHHSGEYEDNDDYDVFDYKLETLCEHYGIYRNDQHRALSDAYATSKLLKDLIVDKTGIIFPPAIFPKIEEEPEIPTVSSISTEPEEDSSNGEPISTNNQQENTRIVKNMKKRSNSREIIQMDDDENIISQFDSISAAVKQTGINSKSIRDAANGIQKHAGGYVWRYKHNSITDNIEQ